MADLDQLSEISQNIRNHNLEDACKRFEQAVSFGKGYDEALLCFQDIQNRLRAITAKVEVMADEILPSNSASDFMLKERAK